jgi:hypothetical protein
MRSRKASILNDIGPNPKKKSNMRSCLSSRQPDTTHYLDNARARGSREVTLPTLMSSCCKISVLMMQTGYLNPRLMEALALEERARVNLIDVALEAEDALRGRDLGEFPVPNYPNRSEAST